jgi:hypothetical protein
LQPWKVARKQSAYAFAIEPTASYSVVTYVLNADVKRLVEELSVSSVLGPSTID